MTLHTALDALIRFEERVCSFYVWLSSVVHDDAEVAQLFITLAEQEQGHAERLRMEQRALVDQERSIMVEGVDKAVESSVRAMDAFMEGAEHPSVLDALGFALGLEADSGEQLGRHLLRDAVPELAKTLDGLDKEDAWHAEMMQECLAIRRRRATEFERQIG